MKDTQHHVVVEVDQQYLDDLAKVKAVTDEDRAEAFLWKVECSDEKSCPGYVECTEDHGDVEPAGDDETDLDADHPVVLHGKEHVYSSMRGDWVLLVRGCPVVFNTEQSMSDCPAGVDLTRVGRYLVEDDWDDTYMTLSVVKEIS